MKLIKIITIACFVSVFVSCKQEQETPKVIYEDTKKSNRDSNKDDTSQIKVADLPINMEGTKYLIYAIGDVRLYEDRSKNYGSSNTNYVSYAISNYNRFELTGYFQNLKFQHVDSLTMHTLTDKQIQIQTVTYLNTIAERTKKQILVYTLVDSDTNKDYVLDQNDIKSLYLSEINGKKFIKLSDDLHELVDWSIIESQNRLYFRTIEDINKNGAFDKDDRVHYHYVNLINKEWIVENYDPIE